MLWTCFRINYSSYDGPGNTMSQVAYKGFQASRLCMERQTSPCECERYALASWLKEQCPFLQHCSWKTPIQRGGKAHDEELNKHCHTKQAYQVTEQRCHGSPTVTKKSAGEFELHGTDSVSVLPCSRLSRLDSASRSSSLCITEEETLSAIGPRTGPELPTERG